MLGVSSQGLSLPWDCNIRMFAWTSRWHRGAGCVTQVSPQTWPARHDPACVTLAGITVPHLGALNCNYNYSTLPLHIKCSHTDPLRWNRYHQHFTSRKLTGRCKETFPRSHSKATVDLGQCSGKVGPEVEFPVS